MGSCFGRCWCSCCDCMIFKQQSGASIRRHGTRSKSQTFTLRRQSSSATIEFENLMFDLDLPDSSNSMLQLQPTSVSSWLSFKEQTQANLKETTRLPIAFKPQPYLHLEECPSRSQPAQSELPIFDPLLSRIAEEDCTRLNGAASGSGSGSGSGAGGKASPPDRVSLGSSSVGEFIWENEMPAEDLVLNVNGNELEWDNYEEDNLVFNNETEQLIQEIEEMTQKALNEPKK